MRVDEKRTLGSCPRSSSSCASAWRTPRAPPPTDSFFLRASGPQIIGAYGGRSLHRQSHGESFLALMLHRLRGRGLYILDEPEPALSPTPRRSRSSSSPPTRRSSWPIRAPG